MLRLDRIWHRADRARYERSCGGLPYLVFCMVSGGLNAQLREVRGHPYIYQDHVRLHGIIQNDCIQIGHTMTCHISTQIATWTSLLNKLPIIGWWSSKLWGRSGPGRKLAGRASRNAASTARRLREEPWHFQRKLQTCVFCFILAQKCTIQMGESASKMVVSLSLTRNFI